MQQSVVVTSFEFCNNIALRPARLGKAMGGKHMKLERENGIKKTNISLETNDPPECAGCSPLLLCNVIHSASFMLLFWGQIPSQCKSVSQHCGHQSPPSDTSCGFGCRWLFS